MTLMAVSPQKTRFMTEPCTQSGESPGHQITQMETHAVQHAHRDTCTPGSHTAIDTCTLTGHNTDISTYNHPGSQTSRSHTNLEATVTYYPPNTQTPLPGVTTDTTRA